MQLENRCLLSELYIKRTEYYKKISLTFRLSESANKGWHTKVH